MIILEDLDVVVNVSNLPTSSASLRNSQSADGIIQININLEIVSEDVLPDTLKCNNILQSVMLKVSENHHLTKSITTASNVIVANKPSTTLINSTETVTSDVQLISQ